MTHQHTIKSYDQELDRLRSIIAQMGGYAETQLKDAVESLMNRDTEQARRVIEADKRLDQMEIEAEQLAIEIFARRAPMADDLREIIAALKISGVLERIGDYAKNISKRTTALQASTKVAAIETVPLMATEARRMIRDVLDAFIERDSKLAIAVWTRDEKIDSLYNSLFRELLTYMMETPNLITACTHLLFIAKNIERIGDHATNIAEVVYFAIEGKMMEDDRPKGDITSFASMSNPDSPANESNDAAQDSSD